MQHAVREETQRIDRQESWSEEDVCGYRVFVTRDKHRTELSICPRDWNHIRLGILHCHPKSVGDIERFAKNASALFATVAEKLRECGLDDLRSEYDKSEDKMREVMANLGKRTSPAKTRAARRNAKLPRKSKKK